MDQSDRVYEFVRTIPRGRVMSYGQIADELGQPFTARTVGGYMAYSPEDVPWWRVVGSNGDILIRKRDPRMAKIQAERLLKEGVDVTNEGVADIVRFRYIPGM